MEIQATVDKTVLKPESKDNMERIFETYGREETSLIPILQELQRQYRYLPKAQLIQVAEGLKLPPARVYGVATFYSHFTLSPKGKYVIRVCDGTACHVKGSMHLAETVREELGLPEDKNTTDDLLFTLETVSCLGACGLAPVLVVNDEVHGQMNSEKTAELIRDLRDRESRECTPTEGGNE